MARNHVAGIMGFTLILSSLPVGLSEEEKKPERDELKNPARPNNLKGGIQGAIKIKPDEITSYDLIEKVQQKYIARKYPNYRKIFSFFLKDDLARYVEVVSLLDSEENNEIIMFDMTDVYKHLKTKDKATKEKIEWLETNYMEPAKIDS